MPAGCESRLSVDAVGLYSSLGAVLCLSWDGLVGWCSGTTAQNTTYRRVRVEKPGGPYASWLTGDVSLRCLLRSIKLLGTICIAVRVSTKYISALCLVPCPYRQNSRWNKSLSEINPQLNTLPNDCTIFSLSDNWWRKNDTAQVVQEITFLSFAWAPLNN